jgi:hypothetical protein
MTSWTSSRADSDERANFSNTALRTGCGIKTETCGAHHGSNLIDLRSWNNSFTGQASMTWCGAEQIELPAFDKLEKLPRIRRI